MFAQRESNLHLRIFLHHRCDQRAHCRGVLSRNWCRIFIENELDYRLQKTEGVNRNEKAVGRLIGIRRDCRLRKVWRVYRARRGDIRASRHPLCSCTRGCYRSLERGSTPSLRVCSSALQYLPATSIRRSHLVLSSKQGVRQCGEHIESYLAMRRRLLLTRPSCAMNTFRIFISRWSILLS